MRDHRESSFSNPSALKRWLQWVGILLCLCSVLLASGFHTITLQLYGWARMYDAYSDAMPSATALTLTFSGVELCGICVLSQELNQDQDDRVEFALGKQTPLALPNLNSPSLTLPKAKSFLGASSPPRNFQEIVLEFEPPPPRCA